MKSLGKALSSLVLTSVFLQKCAIAPGSSGGQTSARDVNRRVKSKWRAEWRKIFIALAAALLLAAQCSEASLSLSNAAPVSGGTVSYSFGTHAIDTSVTRTLIVLNSGNAGAVLLSVTPRLSAPLSVEGGTCAAGTTIPAGGQCELNVRFAPTTPGHAAATIDLGYRSEGSSESKRLLLWVVATGAHPGAVLSISDAPEFDYRSKVLGTSVSKTFTVTNSGALTANMGAVNDAWLGLTTPFSITGGSCLSASLAGVPAWDAGTAAMFAAFGSTPFPPPNGLFLPLEPSIPLIGLYPRQSTCTIDIRFSPVSLGPAVNTIRLGYTWLNSPVGEVASRTIRGTGAEFVPVLQVAAGGEHSCALLSSGKLRCWGSGDLGRLGYGNLRNIGDDEVPSLAGDVTVGGDVTQVVAAYSHTCALLSSGKARCWGRNVMLQLGYDDWEPVGDDELPASAGDVRVDGTVVQLTAGVDHTCALLSNRKVRCWGDNWNGALGTGTSAMLTASQAADVNVGGDVVQISAGSSHTCALLTNGKVRCWGFAGGGQLGYGNTRNIGDNELPASAGDVQVGGDVIQISAGGAHTCALLSNRKVRCWGSGEYGRLGYGNTNAIGDDELPASAGDVSVGGEVVQIAANSSWAGPSGKPGGGHTCALLVTGKVRCWGLGVYGQLGYGSHDDIGDDELPSSAGDVRVGGDVTQISTGGNHTCAVLSNGSVRCWGEGQSGQTGHGNTEHVGDNELPTSAGDVSLQ